MTAEQPGSKLSVVSAGRDETALRGELSGNLPGGCRLPNPIPILILVDEGEFVATEPRFHIHGTGSDRRGAEEDLRQALVDSLELLEEDEAHLDPYLREQLTYLCQIIARA